MKKLMLLLPLLFSNCADMYIKTIIDKPENVKDYYINILQGNLGCMKDNIHIVDDIKTSGLCGSVDTFRARCKNTKYICTITSSLVGGDISHAGITNSATCKPQINCKKERN